ncbi:MAG: PIN domain-containing protein [Bacillota bacterium]|nr:PIN domain-containing protein [Bacillota bacterium]
MKVYVDTSAWISLVAEREPHHAAVAEAWGTLLSRGVVPVTSSDVVSETITRLRYHAGHAVALRFYELLSEAVQKERLVLRWVDAALFEQAWRIFREYRDQEFSMVDCTSFALCRRERITQALTLDHHFRVAGLEVIPAMAARE